MIDAAGKQAGEVNRDWSEADGPALRSLIQ
jgi:hypothetical protein